MTAAFPSVWIQDLTWEEVSSYLERERIVIVPVGSTEQHGPAGVLGVDSYVAMTLAEDVAERMGALVAPPIWYGDSSHHGAFPGTITVRPDTLTLLIRGVARSLARHGFDRIILLNGHKGSNLPALNSAVRVLHDCRRSCSRSPTRCTWHARLRPRSKRPTSTTPGSSNCRMCTTGIRARSGPIG
jgi:creatinine amidohydrolase